MLTCTCRTVALIIITICALGIVCIILAIFLGIATNGDHAYLDLKTTTYLAPVQTTPSVTISRPTGINVHLSQKPLHAGYVYISGMLTLDLPFTDAFNVKTSEEYKRLVQHFYDTVDTIFQGSDALYDHTIVTDLERHDHTTNMHYSIEVNAELQDQMRVFVVSALQDEKIGEIKILYVEIDPGSPDKRE